MKLHPVPPGGSTAGTFKRINHCIGMARVMAIAGVLLVFGLALSITSAWAQAQPAVKLTAAGYAPSTHVMHRSLDDFLKNIGAKSDGRIASALHPTGSLVGAREMLQAGRTGTADIVSIATSNFPAEFRFSGDAGTLLFLWDLSNFDKAIEVIRPSLEAELSAQNLRLLWMVGTVTQWFMRKPMDLNIPDWTGRKIRGFGGASNRVIEILGGTNVAIANNELGTAAATGVIDGLGTSLGSFMGFGIQKEMPCMILTNDVPVIAIIAINKDTWNKIPAPLQMLMDQEARSIQASYLKVLRTEEATSQSKAKTGTTCAQEFTPEQRAVWRKKMTPLYADFRKKHGATAEAFLADLTKKLQ